MLISATIEVNFGLKVANTQVFPNEVLDLLHFCYIMRILGLEVANTQVSKRDFGSLKFLLQE